MPLPAQSQPTPPAPDASGLARRILSGVGSLGGSMVAWSLLQFLSVPIFLHHWGMDGYAAWLAVNAQVGLLGLLDCGLQAHLTSQIRTAAACADQNRLERVLAHGLALYAGLAALGLLLLMIMAGLGSADWLGLGPDAPLIQAILGSCIVLTMPRTLLSCIFSARGELATEVGLNAIHQMAPLLLQMAAAALGGGLLWAALIQLACTLALGWGSLLFWLRRRHRDITLSMAWPDSTQLRHYGIKSIWHSVPNLVGWGTIQLPILLLQSLAGDSAQVVGFATIRTFANLLRQILQQVTVALVQEMTRQYAQGDLAGLARLHGLTCKALTGSGAAATGFMLLAGGVFFNLWTRGSVEFMPLTALCFLACVLMTLPAQCTMSLLRHCDHPEPLVAANLGQLTLAALLLGILVPAFAPPGHAALGAALAVNGAEIIALAFPILIQGRKFFGLSIRETVSRCGSSMALGLGAGLASGWLCLTWLAPRSLGGLILTACAWSALTVPALPFLMLDQAGRRTLWRRFFP